MINQTKDSWQQVKLADVVHYINRGIPPIYTEDNSGTVVINQKCIRDEQINFGTARLTDESVRTIPEDKLVQPYDILVNSTGTGTVGRVGQVTDLKQRTTVDSHVTIVRPKKEEIDPIYLGVWLKAQKEKLEAMAEGSSNQVELSRDKISNLEVILPPKKTQLKIASIIATIDKAIIKTDKIIKKTEELKKGLMSELLTKGIGHKKLKKTKLTEIPEEWNLASIQSLIDNQIIEPNQDGNHGELHPKSSDFIQKGIPFITAADLHNDTVDLSTCKFIAKDQAYHLRVGFAKTGDILLTHKGTVGLVALLNTQEHEFVMLSPQVTFYRVKNNKILNIYLKYLFQADYFQQQLKIASRQSTRDFLSITNQRKLLVLIPGSIFEQEKIASILEKVDKKLNIYKNEGKKLNFIKEGILQDIFSQRLQIS